MQFIPGLDQIWVAKLNEGDPEYIYNTEQEAINKAALLNRGTSAKKSPYNTDIVDLAYTNLLNSYDTIEGFKADFGARLDAKGIERLNSIAFQSTSLKVPGRAETATYRFVLPQTGFSASTTAKDVLDALDTTLSNNVVSKLITLFVILIPAPASNGVMFIVSLLVNKSTLV